MTVAAVILSVPLILEFTFAPVNLWTGRTMDNFVRFTGFRPPVATLMFAPAKLITAALLIAGVFAVSLGIAGAALAVAIPAVYLARLAGPGRRDPSGLVAFTLFGALAAALLAVRLAS